MKSNDGDVNRKMCSKKIKTNLLYIMYIKKRKGEKNIPNE